jgi:hypothetical protein
VIQSPRYTLTIKPPAFANDLTNPQLAAITHEVNSAKGDKGPEEWKSPGFMANVSVLEYNPATFTDKNGNTSESITAGTQ